MAIAKTKEERAPLGSEFLWFSAPCPNCGKELSGLKYPKEIWELPGALGSETSTCRGCGEQIAAKQDFSPENEPRLMVSMHTMPTGAAAPDPVLARQVDPPSEVADAPPQSVDEMFTRIVEPWREANRDVETPDYVALGRALEPYPRWRAVAWQDVGRSGPYGGEETAWLRAQQCYVEALRYDSHPNFLGWGRHIGESYWDKEEGRMVDKDPAATALNERISNRAALSDAERAQLVRELRAYIGAPGEPLPSPEERAAALAAESETAESRTTPEVAVAEAAPAEVPPGGGGLLGRLLGGRRER